MKTTTWNPKKPFPYEIHERIIYDKYCESVIEARRAHDQLIRAISERIAKSNPFVLSIPDLPQNFTFDGKGVSIKTITLDGDLVQDLLEQEALNEV